MATASTTPQRKNEGSLPPKRGKVKALIFVSVVKTVVSAASKAKQALRGEGGDGKSSSSTNTTPLQSGYNSEGNGDIS